MQLTEDASRFLKDKDRDIFAFMQERHATTDAPGLPLASKFASNLSGPLISSEMVSRLPRANPVGCSVQVGKTCSTV